MFESLARLCVPVCVIVGIPWLGGCSSVPLLEEATGTTQSDVMMGKVVARIRCEIADSLDDYIEQPDYLWLADWTAKVDLTLQANDNGGIAPGISYTSFFKNAFNFGAGSTSLTSNSIAAVNQFFTFGASANLSEQAVRAEVISFSLSLKELKRWRRRVTLYEATHPDDRICLGRDGSGVTGYLGLKEWIASALYPVGPDSIHDLQAGYHPSPVNTVKPSSAPGAPKGGALAGGGKPITYSEEIDRMKKATDAAQAASTAASASAGRIADVIPQIRRAIDSSFAVLEPDLKRKIQGNLDSLRVYAKEATAVVAVAQGDAKRAKKIYDETLSVPLPGNEIVPVQPTLDAEDAKDHALAQQQYVANLETEANKIVGGLKHIDPPIDSLLHSVQFVLSYGVSVSPNWTLLQFKGPSPTGASTGSAAGQRTHVLNIALGPTGNNAEQNRLIQNQSVTGPH
jgi:hypothetical protein